MVVESPLYGERTWFFDTRSPVRRMGVSTHGGDSTMVISLWQGDICTGTFRLPAQEAARLISTLAYGMSESIAGEGLTSAPTSPARARDLWSRLVGRLAARLTRASGATTDSPLRLLK